MTLNVLSGGGRAQLAFVEEQQKGREGGSAGRPGFEGLAWGRLPWPWWLPGLPGCLSVCVAAGGGVKSCVVVLVCGNLGWRVTSAAKATCQPWRGVDVVVPAAVGAGSANVFAHEYTRSACGSVVVITLYCFLVGDCEHPLCVWPWMIGIQSAQCDATACLSSI